MIMQRFNKINGFEAKKVGSPMGEFNGNILCFKKKKGVHMKIK